MNTISAHGDKREGAGRPADMPNYLRGGNDYAVRKTC
jgi:hypothetical protein